MKIKMRIKVQILQKNGKAFLREKEKKNKMSHTVQSRIVDPRQ